MTDLYSRFGSFPAPLPSRVRLDDGQTVTDLSGIDKDTLLALGFQKVGPKPVPSDLQKVGWDGSDWVLRDKTQEELLDDVPWNTLQEAEEALVVWIDDLTTQIKRKYPEIVREEWLVEEATARAYDSGNASPEQIVAITADANAANRTAAEHATRVIEKADALRQISGLTRPLWLETRTALREAVSPLQYPAIFEAAVAKVTPLAQQNGLKV